jgi:hypothetical protein
MLMIPEMLQVVIIGLMLLIPVCMIYKKAGFNPVWAILLFLPGFGLLLIFMHLAFIPWPNAQHQKEF